MGSGVLLAFPIQSVALRLVLALALALLVLRVLAGRQLRSPRARVLLAVSPARLLSGCGHRSPHATSGFPRCCVRRPWTPDRSHSVADRYLDFAPTAPILLGFWAAATLLLTAGRILRSMRFRRDVLRRAVPAPPRVAVTVVRLARDFGVTAAAGTPHRGSHRGRGRRRRMRDPDPAARVGVTRGPRRRRTRRRHCPRARARRSTRQPRCMASSRASVTSSASSLVPAPRSRRCIANVRRPIRMRSPSRTDPEHLRAVCWPSSGSAHTVRCRRAALRWSYRAASSSVCVLSSTTTSRPGRGIDSRSCWRPRSARCRTPLASRPEPSERRGRTT